ncbi:hypothetical protein [Absidia glauca]|uniref:Uncharacterized protein n=1 Tax=Absidia glauca TaxID=4829 RepID=A0A163JRI7_ABSGL|nr:hypothetical protein [Absidia glauca]
MSATVSRSDPVPIPNVNDAISYSYKEIVRNLTANAPQPYGAIPPLMKKHKSKKKRHSRQKQQQKQQKQAVRRMSHVENWVAVDSKESIPDEDELIHSPFQNFLSVDFLTGILPLHMPPPSLSDPTTLIEQQEIAKFAYHHRQKAANIFDASDTAAKRDPNTLFDQEDDDDDDDDEDDDDDDDEEDEYEDEDESDFSPPDTMRSTNSRTTGRKQQNLGATNDTPPLSLSLSPPLPSATAAATITTAISASTTGLSTEIDDIAVGNTLHVHKSLVGRRSIPSFTKSHTPSTSTTTSYAMSSSPPDQPDRKKWIHTIAKLRQSLALSQPPPSTASNSFLTNSPAAAAATTIDITAATKPCSKSLPSSLSSSPDHHASNEKLAAPLPALKKSSSTATTSKKGSGFIPMPLPPRRKRSSKKRRSEATTQPRFNFDTNTYTRDTRSNPDHLRMIAAELNMMRSRKLFSPLKPRGFLPRRKDPFICGDGRLRSPLQFELQV